jgi:hypothetical protein
MKQGELGIKSHKTTPQKKRTQQTNKQQNHRNKHQYITTTNTPKNNKTKN